MYPASRPYEYMQMRSNPPPYPARIQTNVPPQYADVPRMVSALLASTKHLQEMLRKWSVLHVSEQQVVDTYLRVGADFNATVTAFQYYNIDLSELYSMPEQLRVVLETCLGDEPSPHTLAMHMPRVKQIIFTLLQGLRSKQPAYWRATGQSPAAFPPYSP